MTLYYSPEDYGAELIGAIDVAGAWEYAIFLVLKDKSTGKLYYGQESGCSCPIPFEGYNSVTELREITDYAAFAREIRLHAVSNCATTSDKEYAEKILRSVRARMRNRK